MRAEILADTLLTVSLLSAVFADLTTLTIAANSLLYSMKTEGTTHTLSTIPPLFEMLFTYRTPTTGNTKCLVLFMYTDTLSPTRDTIIQAFVPAEFYSSSVFRHSPVEGLKKEFLKLYFEKVSQSWERECGAIK
jgi:hypothetical protein